MSNEFVARNGIISQNNIQVTGSLNISNGVTGSFSGTVATASYVALAQTASYAANVLSASFSTTAGYALTPTVQGTEGTQGIVGVLGPQGTVGTQGGQGITGNIGIQGIAGTQGTQGPIGIQGLVSPPGIIGIIGPKGTQGTGPGSQGAQGGTGRVGPQGATGSPGPQGTTGPTGPPGRTGATSGVTGSPGPVGPPGSQGGQGATGPPGGIGPTGSPGPNGLSGSAGYIAKYTSSSAAGTGYAYDDGSQVLIGNTTASTNQGSIWMYRPGGAGYGRINIIKTSPGANDAVANYSSGTYVGGIVYADTTCSFPTSSDYRLKYDLRDFDGTSLLSRIKVYDFAWKLDDTRSYGVIAHELQEVLSDAVTGEKDRMGSNGEIKSQGVDYSKIVPVLIKTIQELQERIIQLNSK